MIRQSRLARRPHQATRPRGCCASAAPLRARQGRRCRGRIRHGRRAVPGADVRHHGNRDRLLRRPALETAVADCARLIMTGQAQTQASTRRNSSTRSARKIYGLFDCNGGLNVDVKNYSAFCVDQHRQADRRNGNLQTQLRLSARRPGRHRGGAADVSMAGLCFAARPQPGRHGGQQAPADVHHRVPQRTISMRRAMTHRSRMLRRARRAGRSAGCCATSAASPRSNSRCCCR